MEKENNINFTNAITLVHSIIKQKKNGKINQIFIDGTCGNGHDTIFLTSLGYVYSFDIQYKAIEIAKGYNLKNVSYINDCHSKIGEYIKENIDGAIFNLGYLPGGDKQITTKKETTLLAIMTVLELLKSDGVLCIIVYPGHKDGKDEESSLLNYLSELNQKEFNVMVIDFLNRINNSPYPIIIERIRRENE
ncbi:MAG: class I SAM-dependent methyltransferase [Firmicutes bacterium]|nr:class I SAM-dependent methyltransferase [Bacillota bacterium]